MSELPALSIIIPAYNEMRRLPATIHAVRHALDRRDETAELVLVDDGSRDGTHDLIARAALDDPRVIPVLQTINRGKGAAIRAGVAHSRGERVVFFDADLAYGLDAIDEATRRIADGADLAIGARDLLAHDTRHDYPPARRLATQVFNSLVERALALGIRDTQCGFKMFRGAVARALFDALTVDHFGFDVEILYLARRWGLRIDRIPLSMPADDDDDSSVRVVHDGLKMALDIARIWQRARRGVYPPRPPGV